MLTDTFHKKMRCDHQEKKTCPVLPLLSTQMHIHPQGGQGGHSGWELFLTQLYLVRGRCLAIYNKLEELCAKIAHHSPLILARV